MRFAGVFGEFAGGFAVSGGGFDWVGVFGLASVASVVEVADAAGAAVPLGTVPFVTYFVHRPLLESEGIVHRP